MKNVTLVFILVLFLIASMATAEVTVKMVNPAHYIEMEPCDTLVLKAEVTATEEEDIKRLLFGYNGKSIKSVRSEPYEYTIEGLPSGYYRFYAGATVGSETIYSDTVRVKVGNGERDNVLVNNFFECGQWPWGINLNDGAEAEFDFKGDGLYINVIEPRDIFWKIGIEQKFYYHAGHQYEIHITAAADEARPMALEIRNGETIFWQPFDLTDEEQEFIFTYPGDHAEDIPSARIILMVGQVATGVTLYEASVIDLDWTETDIESQRVTHLPLSAQLAQNYPNPFNPSTSISFQLEKPQDVTLSVCNHLGQHIRTLVAGDMAAGHHVVKWNGLNYFDLPVPSGVYFYELVSEDGEVLRNKMVLAR